MSDLISRSELYDELGNKLTWLMAYGDDVYLDVGSDIKDVIDNMPTAYDIENVVDELEKTMQDLSVIEVFSHIDFDSTIQSSLDNFLKAYNSELLRIIKQGGVSDDVCEWIKYDYRTICPKNHDANNPYWRIPDNTDKLKYCPYCGKKIKVVEQNDN